MSTFQSSLPNGLSVTLIATEAATTKSKTTTLTSTATSSLSARGATAGSTTMPLQNSLLLPKRSKICSVCGEVKTSYILSYGASTCLSCRAFFRRSVVKGKGSCTGLMACRFPNAARRRCEITVKSRTKCSACRLAACLDAGMNPNAVMDEDQKKQRFRKMFKKKDVSEDAKATRASRGTEAKQGRSKPGRKPKALVDNDAALQTLSCRQRKKKSLEMALPATTALSRIGLTSNQARSESSLLQSFLKGQSSGVRRRGHLNDTVSGQIYLSSRETNMNKSPVGNFDIPLQNTVHSRPSIPSKLRTDSYQDAMSTSNHPTHVPFKTDPGQYLEQDLKLSELQKILLSDPPGLKERDDLGSSSTSWLTDQKVIKDELMEADHGASHEYMDGIVGYMGAIDHRVGDSSNHSSAIEPVLFQKSHDDGSASCLDNINSKDILNGIASMGTGFSGHSLPTHHKTADTPSSTLVARLCCSSNGGHGNHFTIKHAHLASGESSEHNPLLAKILTSGPASELEVIPTTLDSVQLMSGSCDKFIFAMSSSNMSPDTAPVHQASVSLVAPNSQFVPGDESLAMCYHLSDSTREQNEYIANTTTVGQKASSTSSDDNVFWALWKASFEKSPDTLNQITDQSDPIIDLTRESTIDAEQSTQLSNISTIDPTVEPRVITSTLDLAAFSACIGDKFTLAMRKASFGKLIMQEYILYCLGVPLSRAFHMEPYKHITRKMLNVLKTHDEFNSMTHQQKMALLRLRSLHGAALFNAKAHSYSRALDQCHFVWGSDDFDDYDRLFKQVVDDSRLKKFSCKDLNSSCPLLPDALVAYNDELMAGVYELVDDDVHYHLFTLVSMFSVPQDDESNNPILQPVLPRLRQMGSTYEKLLWKYLSQKAGPGVANSLFNKYKTKMRDVSQMADFIEVTIELCRQSEKPQTNADSQDITSVQ